MGYPTDEMFEEARTNRAPPRPPAMTLNAYQKAALRTARVNEDDKTNPLDLARDALGVAGEAGEVADLIKKVIGHGHPLDKEKFAKELGDVLWYVAVLAHRLNYTLEEVAAQNVEKLRKRYPEGFSEERSKNRQGE